MVSPLISFLETIMTDINTSKYFDLHTFALGYVEDIREVPVRKGSFLACRYSAIRTGTNGTTRFDLKVVGGHAKACINALKAMADAGQSVMVQAKIGDIYAEHFKYKAGKREGEFGVNIKGRMLKVYSATADGKPVELPPVPYKTEEAKAPPAGLVTSGVGYLNRVKKVSIGEGEHLWMASIAALRGDLVEGGKVETTRFVLATAPEALDAAQSLQDALLAKKKVLVGFEAGNIRAELFQYERGDKKGQTDAVLKGALMRLAWAKVDGEEFPLAEQAA